jgi:glycosyltransferase involved in cell wall biosynthesis
MARGIPVVTTPLPLAAGLVERHECGFVVPFGDPPAAAEAVLTLQRDPALREAMGRRGHQGASEYLRWPEDAQAFVSQLERWAGADGPAGQLESAEAALS